MIHQFKKDNNNQLLGRQDIGAVFHKNKTSSKNVNDKCYSYIVHHLDPDLAVVDISWCAPSRSIPLKSAS
jgi:hypothetical protein